MTQHSVTESGSTLRAAVGDEVVIVVPERATAGYEWDFAADLPAGVEAVTTPQPEPPETGIGGDVPRAIGVRVTAEGTFTVELIHARSWEGPASSIGTFTVTIEAAPAG